MTVKHHGECDAQGLIDRVGDVMKILGDRATPFNMLCNVRRKFGFKRKIPVLLPSGQLPAWVFKLSDGANWNPHVATEEESLVLTVEAVAIMSRKEEIYRWNLT